MIKPFHLSIVVPDIAAAKQFYCNFLNCPLGHDAGSWVNILFYGHQLTIHQESQSMKSIPIDHFGPIMDKADWLTVADTIKKNDIPFVMPPSIKNQNQPDESGKFLIRDPAGHLLEFKFYSDFNQTVTQ